MSVPKKIWREKRLAPEECDGSESTDRSSVDEAGKVEVNMVFEWPAEFRVPEDEVAELALGQRWLCLCVVICRGNQCSGS
jgi:hypothetical protein